MACISTAKAGKMTSRFPSTLLLFSIGWFVTIGLGIIGLVLIALAIPLALRNRPNRVHPAALGFSIIALLYFAYWAIGGWFFPPMDNYWDSISRILPVLVLGALPLVLQTEIGAQNHRHYWFYLASVAGVVTLLATVSLSEIIDGNSRAAGFHGNALLAGSGLLVGVMMPFSIWHRLSFPLQILFVILFALTFLTAFMFVEARASSLILLVTGGPILTCLILAKIKGRNRWIWRLAVFTTICVLAIAALYFVLEISEHRAVVRMRNGIIELLQSLQQQNNGQTLRDKSVSARALMWQQAWLAIQEAPIWGHGVHHRFDAVDETLFRRFGPSFTHLHNSVLNHAVGGGLVGVGFYITLTFYPLLFFAYTRWRAPSYWLDMSPSLRREILWLGLLVTAIPFFTGLSNVVMFESTLATIALVPLAYWVMRLPVLKR